MGRVELAARVLGVESQVPAVTRALCQFAGWPILAPGPGLTLLEGLVGRLDAVDDGVLRTPRDLTDAAVLPHPRASEVSDEILSHISPGHSDNINFFGVINVDVEAELAKLDTSGWRPLRPAQLRELRLTP
ncbi:hypothetical protein GCM10010404_91310 [Nonomuraea africana]|uniref:Uncharacterized protein n=1 Tax=Nonomuraea africana TaxID=46171 RepID=A0ABR9KDJ3_9ACTN|nr:hypothetical protein [Nonomuraea africana]MBE1560075.1 hypothetical protein [Nonomuraea africana]